MTPLVFSTRLRKWLLVDRTNCCAANAYRHITSSEISTALRPFYFSVHPDLFGQYPSERAVNENSLQKLSSFITTVQQDRPPHPTTLKFYLRPQASDSGHLKAVRISLAGSDMRKTIASILSSCDLPTTYVDNIAAEQLSAPPGAQPPFQSGHMEFRSTQSQQFYQTINKAKEALMLRSWLESNITSARQKLQACEPVRADLVRLQRALCKSLELKHVLWDCGWNVTHFRGCLLSFQALAQQHPETMDILKGRTLVFGNNTGISLDGYVLLNSGEVRHNWLDFIKNLWKDDAVLLTVPSFEKAASRVLKDIQIVRRKFQPQTMAKQYENNLRRLTTSMSDLQGRSGYPNSWPESLQDYELVVETEAGPLMLSPTGQFIVPASCPSFLLVNFITENLQQAAQLLQTYKKNKLVEDELHGKCMTQLGLTALQKDDSITPNLMIPCCQQLLVHIEQLGPYLNNTRLFITTYYSVMSDGQICIPWNFKL